MRGFKSFPDQVEVRLEPGVAVVVGPNGSGKSNIADALVWASGSLAPSELRAEKPDDVLFAGSAGRAAAEFCEVELLFDNADQALPGIDFSEVSIVRRLHRGGEGQYLVNAAQERGHAVVQERKELEQRLESFLQERERVEEELAAVAGGREGAAAALYRLRSGRERLDLRREAADELAARLREPVVEHVG